MGDIPNKILVVDDEAKIVEVVKSYLENGGYHVVEAYNGKEALEKFEQAKPALVILDLMLPDISGEEICKTLRKRSRVPIIMLTAKVEEEDILRGLNIGADDYVTKPFAIEELLARIRVALKRKNNTVKRENDVLKAGDLVLNKTKHTVTYKDEEIPLSKKEYDLLEYMMENRGIVLTREQLIEKVWGYDYYGDTNVTDVYIRYLRAKIDQKYNLSYIKTVRGVGYIFECDE